MHLTSYVRAGVFLERCSGGDPYLLDSEGGELEALPFLLLSDT